MSLVGVIWRGRELYKYLCACNCVVCSSKCLSINKYDAKATAVGEAKKGGGGEDSEDDWEDMERIKIWKMTVTTTIAI